MKLIEDLKWRYATKKFDPEKKVSKEHLSEIMEAIRLSPSSLGLQPIRVLHITDPNLRKQLREVSWGQSALTDASDIFVFCNKTTVPDTYLEYMADLHQAIRKTDDQTRENQLKFVRGYMSTLSESQIEEWSEKECYLSAGVALVACAELHIDSCPIGGFDPDGYDSILGLSEMGLNASLVIAIGYRAEDDGYQYAAKVRKPMSDLFMDI